MVNFKGGAILSLIINGSLWTLESLYFSETHKTWVVAGFLSLSILGLIIMLLSIIRYSINIKSSTQTMNKLAIKKSNPLKNFYILLLIAAVSVPSASLFPIIKNTKTASAIENTLSINNALISLTFDDGPISDYEEVLPLMTAKGQKGTFYITTGFIGKPGYMSWSQVQTMKNKGMDIGAHTVNHLELPNYPVNIVNQELKRSLSQLKQKGITATEFAAPFGAYDLDTTASVAKLYNSQRAFKNIGLNIWPYNKYTLNVRYVEKSTSVDTVKQWIQEAGTTGNWLVVVFHEVPENENDGDALAWPSGKFAEVLDYMNQNNIKAKTVNEVLNGFENYIPNSGFENGMSSFTTDAPGFVSLDQATNGSFPGSKKSIRMVGNSKAAHLFSSKININHNLRYGIRVYADTRSFTQGELGFYIDEYDSAGNWISGKWIGGINRKNVTDYAYKYTPTNTNVKKAAVQIYTTAGTGGVFYIDNVEFFSAK